MGHHLDCRAAIFGWDFDGLIHERAAVNENARTREKQIRAWLAPLGFRKTKPDPKLDSNFGDLVEFLLAEGGSGDLYRFLDSIPSATVSDKFQRRYVEVTGKSILIRWEEIADLEYQAEKWPAGLMGALGFPIERKPTRLKVEFDRSFTRASLKIERWWGVPEVVAQVEFFNYPAADFSVEAGFTEVTLTAVGLTTRNVRWAEDLTYPALKKTGVATAEGL
jgi:hypothetical protein